MRIPKYLRSSCRNDDWDDEAGLTSAARWRSQEQQVIESRLSRCPPACGRSRRNNRRADGSLCRPGAAGRSVTGPRHCVAQPPAIAPAGQAVRRELDQPWAPRRQVDQTAPVSHRRTVTCVVDHSVTQSKAAGIQRVRLRIARRIGHVVDHGLQVVGHANGSLPWGLKWSLTRAIRAASLPRTWRARQRHCAARWVRRARKAAAPALD